MKTTLSIRIDAELATQLDKESRRANVSRCEIVREAIRLRLHSSDKEADGLLKYAGIMSGPPDLSTNKKHLANLGRRGKTRS